MDFKQNIGEIENVSMMRRGCDADEVSSPHQQQSSPVVLTSSSPHHQHGSYNLVSAGSYNSVCDRSAPRYATS